MTSSLSRLIFLPTAVLCAECFAGSQQSSRGADYTVEQVKANISAAYDHLRAQGGRFQDDYDIQVFRSNGPNEQLEMRTRHKKRARPDGYQLMELNVLEHSKPEGQPKPGDRVLCTNPRYDFRLRANQPGQWLIDRCVVNGTPEYSASDRRDREEALAAGPYDFHYRNGTKLPLPTLFANEKVKVTSMAESPTNAGCYRLSYEGSADNLLQGAKMPASISGWVDISPDLNWSVVELTETTKMQLGEGTSNHRFQTRRVEDVVLVVRHDQTTTSKVNGKDIRTRIAHEFNPRFDSNVDPDEFTLTHYGLPEPVGAAPPPPKPVPRYIWFLIAAAGLAVVAVVSRWLLRKRLQSPNSVQAPA
jgi:hypothetical protein